MIYLMTLFYISIGLLSLQPFEDDKHLFILSGQSNMVRLDPDDSFIPVLVDHFGRDNIIVVKYAMGSQPISRWYNDWVSTDGTIPDLRGDLYGELMKNVAHEIAGQTISSVTFIWVQGERDARIKEGEVYKQSLRGLIDQLKSDLKKEDLNTVIARLNDFDMEDERWPHWTLIRTVQKEIAENDASIELVNTDDLNSGFNANGDKVIDDLHYTVEGYMKLGERCAKAAINLIDGID